MTRKPTYETLTFLFDQPVSVDNVGFGPDGQVVLLNGAQALTPKNVLQGRHRHRNDGREKVIYSFPAMPVPTLGGERDVLASFAYFFTIDTNTVKIRGETVSVGVIAVSAVERNFPRPGIMSLTTIFPGGIEFHGLSADQERLSWVLLQNAIIDSPNYDRSARYLIISDHAQNRHAAINAREEPLFESTMLAPNITLGFATGDSGDSFCQQLVRSCDTHAKAFIRDLRSGKIGDENLKALSEGPVAKFRGIENSGERWPAQSPSRPFRLSQSGLMQFFASHDTPTP